MGQKTLLEQTQHRISRLVPKQRTLLVMTRAHEPFYPADVKALPLSEMLIQPQNKGTAPAILCSLLRLRDMDPAGIVAFFPSDHYFPTIKPSRAIWNLLMPQPPPFRNA